MIGAPANMNPSARLLPEAMAERVSILVIAVDTADVYLPSLRTSFEVTTAASEDQAYRALRAFHPTLVIVDLALRQGDGLALCRYARALRPDPPLLLVTTDVPECVPEALVAGCDGVLLRPFPPNLLAARVGRLLRRRGADQAGRPIWQARTLPEPERAAHAPSTTNIVCPTVHCPSCGAGNAVNFDAGSRRRMWYACIPCRNVWLA